MPETPAHSFLPAELDAATVAGPAPEAPLFGRYRRVRELGRGGMGLVVLAQDLDLDAPVALKLIPELIVQDTDGITDLKKEVLRGMALTHPGIVRVYTFAHDATTAAIVMEYVEGETLGELKARQPDRCFDCAIVRPWLEQLCEVLDYAHREARIAHRDLKPRNLILTPGGRLKVADFGISSSLSDTLSRVSVRVDASGTPPYMSPQQARGARPSHLDDIYSLGATFYELLTGKPPFFRGNVLAQVLEAKPASLEERRAEFGIVGREPIPAAWEALIAACLAKDPAARPPDATAILRYLESPPTTAAAGLAPATPEHEPLRIRLPETARSGSSPAPIIRTHHPYRPRAKPAFDWVRTFATVIAAAALTAGAGHAARTWARTRPPATTAPVAAAPASALPAASPPPVLGASSNLDISRLDKPPTASPRNSQPPPWRK